MNLTDRVIQEANYEGESFLGESGRWEWSQYEIWDHETPGLGVRISPNNSKVFILAQLSGDHRETIVLGNVGEITLDEARAAALNELAQSSAAKKAPAESPRRPEDNHVSKAQGRTAGPQQETVEKSPPGKPRSGSQNRRRHPRLRVVMVVARSENGAAEIMDLSRTGMAIETPQSIPVGAVQKFQISNRTHQLEVDGRVQWCKTKSISGSTTEESDTLFQVGVAFTKLHTEKPEGIFAGLRADSARSEEEFFVEPERQVETGNNKPLVTIVTPRNGSTVYSSPVTVLGIVQGPLHDMPLEVEGVEAKIDGEWFEAEIPLELGSNRISAAVPSQGSVLYRSPVIEVTLDPSETE
jgi:hypothetical protein